MWLGCTPYTREYGTARKTCVAMGCMNLTFVNGITSWDDVWGFWRQDFKPLFTSLERAGISGVLISLSSFMVVDPGSPLGFSELRAREA